MNSMILGVDDLSLIYFFTTREERKLQLAACHVITSKVIHIRSGTILRREVSEKLPQG